MNGSIMGEWGGEGAAISFNSPASKGGVPPADLIVSLNRFMYA